MSDDPHHAFREASRYVHEYLEQVSRLLQDITVALGRRNYRMLRPNGPRLMSNIDTVATESEGWLAKWLFAFFAPSSAFRGAAYGVQASAVPRVMFVGAALADADDAPALWLGWVQEHHGEDILEKQLQSLYDSIDPPSLSPVPVPVTALSEVAFQLATVGDSSLRMALARVPLSLVGDAADVTSLASMLADAVETSLEGTSP